ACVLPVAYYGSEAWWPGRSRQGTQGRISNRVDSLLQLLDKVVLTSARAILPVYRTTPTAALHRESGLPPSEIALNGRTTAATVRLRHLDPRHPLLRRAGKIISLNRPTSRFARRVLALPQAEQINLIALPPWAPREGREEAYARVGGPCGASKEIAKQAFNSFISSIPSGDIMLFTDGSKQSDGFAGAGCVAYQGGIQILQKSIPLGKGVEVFDAEAMAALAGARLALELPTTKFATNLWIFLDNLEVATRILGPFSGTSQSVFEEFLKIEPEWQCRSRLPHTRPGGVK
ncbi:hypothetical protein K3495_g16362, partial [Podosphaera aphanis]